MDLIITQFNTDGRMVPRPCPPGIYAAQEHHGPGHASADRIDVRRMRIGPETVWLAGMFGAGTDRRAIPRHIGNGPLPDYLAAKGAGRGGIKTAADLSNRLRGRLRRRGILLAAG